MMQQKLVAIVMQFLSFKLESFCCITTGISKHPVLQKKQVSSATRAAPNLQSLTLIKWKVKGKTQRLSVIRSIAGNKWKKAGILLGIPPHELAVISKRNPNEPVDCCKEVFTKWLEGGCTPKDYASRITWSDRFT